MGDSFSTECWDHVLMNEILLNLGLILVFVLIGGYFSASELALVSLRESLWVPRTCHGV